jgi:selenocysteine-specific elongation factor
VLRPSRAQPNRSVDRVVAERGWVEADELERLTGERRAPVIGSWVVDPDALRAVQAELRARVVDAGPTGLDLATLDPRQLAVLEADDEVVVAAGRATPAASDDPFPAHPYLAALDHAPFAPPQPADAGVDRSVVRELIRRGLAFEEAGLVFPLSALTGAAGAAAELLGPRPEGFSVSELREALGTTRRFVVPLLARLDRDGVTRRRGDLRIAGPRLPTLRSGPVRREG